MIEIKGLKKYFKDYKAIDIPSLTIPNGCVFSVLGVNGSGKSTLLNLISGVYKQESGEILYDGKSLKEDSLRKDFLYISDDPLSKGQTLQSLYLFYSMFYGMTKEKYEHYLSILEIDLKKPQLDHYSKGMKRRVYLAIALAISPKVLIMDELFDGLDVLGKKVFKRELFNIMEEDPEKMVIIASHTIKDIEGLADQYIILKNGEIALDPSTEEENTYLKVEIAFHDVFDFEQLEELGFKILTHSGKMATLFTQKDEEEIHAILGEYRPAFMNISEMSSEEMFYLKAEEKEDEQNELQ